MTQSVKLKTAVPSLERFGESLGISKARQKTLISIVHKDPAAGRFSLQQAPSPKRAVASVRPEARKSSSKGAHPKKA